MFDDRAASRPRSRDSHRDTARVSADVTSLDAEDAEDTATVLEWKARDAADQTTFVPAEEARRRLGMPPVTLRVDYDERRLTTPPGSLMTRWALARS
jgi:hypothetical protein